MTSTVDLSKSEPGQMPKAGRFSGQMGRGVVAAIPIGWLFIFFALPFLFVLKISLAEAEISVPPYTALLERSSPIASGKRRAKQTSSRVEVAISS